MTGLSAFSTTPSPYNRCPRCFGRADHHNPGGIRLPMDCDEIRRRWVMDEDRSSWLIDMVTAFHPGWFRT